MARPTGRSASSTLPSTSTSAAAATSRIGAAGAARASSRQQPLSPAAPSLLAPSLLARSALVEPAATALAPVICVDRDVAVGEIARSEEHTSELQSLMRISYAVFCLKKKTNTMYESIHSDSNKY